MEGPWEISDLEFLVSMTGCFSPASFSYTGASATSEELRFHPVMDFLGCSKNGWQKVEVVWERELRSMMFVNERSKKLS